jgi:hypothetical protein
MKYVIAIVLLITSCFAQSTGGLQFDRINPAAVNNTYQVDGRAFTTIQAAITAAGTTGSVEIPASYAGVDTYTNPNGILIVDKRAGVLGIGGNGSLSVTTGNITNLVSTGTDTLGTVSVTGTLATNGAITATGGITAGGTTLIKTGTASNTDVAGEATMSSGTFTYTFGNSYTSHPACVASDETSISAVKVTYTGATSVTFTTSGASDVVSYVCVGRN